MPSEQRAKKKRANASPAKATPRPLPLPDPYPDYITCPHCGTAEIEVWSNATRAKCHNCRQEFQYRLPAAPKLKRRLKNKLRHVRAPVL